MKICRLLTADPGDGSSTFLDVATRQETPGSLHARLLVPNVKGGKDKVKVQ